MNQEERKEIMYRQGRVHALDLRQRAAALTGTVYRCLADNTVYNAEDFPPLWEVAV